LEPRPKAARSKAPDEKKAGLPATLGRLIQRRPWSTATAAGLVAAVGIAGLLFVGFEISDRKLPTYGFWKHTDEIVAAMLPDRPAKLPEPMKAATIQTGLVKLTTDVR